MIVENYGYEGVVSSAHCVYCCLFHVVWCTKYRHPVLSGEVAVLCKEILLRTCEERGWFVVALEVMPDHVHVLLRVPPSVAVCSVVSSLKSVSCNCIFQEFPYLKSERFWGSGLWSRGYFVSTVGSNLDMVKHYIETQHDKPYEVSHC